jgi:hypothetical protein
MQAAPAGKTCFLRECQYSLRSDLRCGVTKRELSREARFWLSIALGSPAGTTYSEVVWMVGSP